MYCLPPIRVPATHIVNWSVAVFTLRVRVCDDGVPRPFVSHLVFSRLPCVLQMRRTHTLCRSVTVPLLVFLHLRF